MARAQGGEKAVQLSKQEQQLCPSSCLRGSPCQALCVLTDPSLSSPFQMRKLRPNGTCNFAELH